MHILKGVFLFGIFILVMTVSLLTVKPAQSAIRAAEQGKGWPMIGHSIQAYTLDNFTGIDESGGQDIDLFRQRYNASDTAQAPENSSENTSEFAAVPARLSSQKFIPLRIVQAVDVASGCPGQPPAACELLPREMLIAAVQNANSFYASLNVKFWIKSIEYYDMPHFYGDDSATQTWATVKTELRQVFPGVPANAYADTTAKTPSGWRNALTALWGDPNELVLWMLSPSGQSYGQLPHVGRMVSFHTNNIWKTDDNGVAYVTSHLGHEIGHVFGLQHVFDFNQGGIPPKPDGTGQQWKDAWDLIFCPSTDDTFYASANEVPSSCPGGFQLIAGMQSGGASSNCHAQVDSYGRISCSVPFTAGARTYESGANALKGLSQLTGKSQTPPTSFDHNVNAMTYYGSWGPLTGGHVDYRVPAFFSASQIELMDTYLVAPTPYAARTQTSMTSGCTVTNCERSAYLSSLLPNLGTVDGDDNQDFLWWGNGDLTFASQTVPITGTLYEPITGDFDGNGCDDILWFVPSTGLGNLWWSRCDGTRTFATSKYTLASTSGYRVVAGDFDCSYGDDILVYKDGASSEAIWYSAPTARTFNTVSVSVAGNYAPFAGNFDGAAGDDIFWYAPSHGQLNEWLSSCTGYAVPSFSGRNHVPVGDGQAYTPVVGNFDGAGGDDVFWYRPGSGQDILWYGRTVIKNAQNVQDTYLPLAGNFDRRLENAAGQVACTDIFWEYRGTTDRLWRGLPNQDLQFDDLAGRTQNVYGQFRPMVGDFDGDTNSDIFWYREN